MKKSTVGILAALAAVTVAGSAQSQICAGFPASERGFYFGARYDLGTTIIPLDDDEWPGVEINAMGVEAAYNAAGPLSVFGGLNVLLNDFNDETANLFRAGAAFEVAALGAVFGPSVSACPTAEVRWISEDGTTLMEIPVGLGIGGDVGIPGNMSVSAHAQPQVVFFRYSGDGISLTENEFGITGGIMVGLGPVALGGDIRHVFADDRDPVFGIRVGIRL